MKTVIYYFNDVILFVFLLTSRYNKLLAVISRSLTDIVKALKGLVVMSSELELMANSLYNNAVPDMWKAKARPHTYHTYKLVLFFFLLGTDQWSGGVSQPLHNISGQMFGVLTYSKHLRNMRR